MMKKLLLPCIISAIVGIVTGFTVCQNTVVSDEKLINSYSNYYKATETLLDTLNEEYNWVDSFDSDYYDCKDELDKLLNSSAE